MSFLSMSCIQGLGQAHRPIDVSLPIKQTHAEPSTKPPASLRYLDKAFPELSEIVEAKVL